MAKIDTTSPPKLVFSCTVKTFDDKVSDNLQLDVQYFDINQNQWVSVGSNKTIQGSFLLEINPKELPTDHFLNESYKIIPQFRLVDSASLSSKEIRVYTIGGTVTTDLSRNIIYYDFNPVWIIDTKIITRRAVDSSDQSVLCGIPVNVMEIVAKELEKTQTIQQETNRAAARSVKEVYSNITNQFALIEEENTNSKYKLSNLSLNLKSFVDMSTGDLCLRLIDGNESTRYDGSAVSTIRIDFSEQSQSSATSFKMPNVVGLTENACRQTLASVGLKLDPVYQLMNAKGTPVGRSLKQSVPAGSIVNPNDLITVIFAKQ